MKVSEWEECMNECADAISMSYIVMVCQFFVEPPIEEHYLALQNHCNALGYLCYTLYTRTNSK